MASYTVNVVNPRKKKRAKKAKKRSAKRKSPKRNATKKAKKKATKKKPAKKKAAKKRAKKTTKRKSTKKKTAKRRSKKATKKLSGKQIRLASGKRGEKLGTVAEDVVDDLVEAFDNCRKETKKVESARRKDRKEINALKKEVQALERRLKRAKKRGDLTKTQEDRLKDALESCHARLDKCAKKVSAAKTTKRKPAKKKATKKRSKKRSPARRRAPARVAPWPSNVPTPGFDGVPPQMTVEQAIHRLSVAGRNMSRFSGQGPGAGAGRGASASGRRMQLSSQGYLQLNPLVEIPGHEGLYAQFKSKKSRRARAVAAKTPRSVKPSGSKSNKQMSAREKASILRKITKI